MVSRARSTGATRASRSYTSRTDPKAARYVINYVSANTTDARVIQRLAAEKSLVRADLVHIGSKKSGKYTHIILDYKNQSHSPRVPIYAFDSGWGRIVVGGALREYVNRKVRCWLSIKYRLGFLISAGLMDLHQPNGNGPTTPEVPKGPENPSNPKASASQDGLTGPKTSPAQEPCHTEEVSPTTDTLPAEDALSEICEDEVSVFLEAVPMRMTWIPSGTPRAPDAVMDLAKSISSVTLTDPKDSAKASGTQH